MKATGIVRRIDDLGRVVIPKELRRTLRIREGDPLEIYVNREGEVILKKYSPLCELGNFAKEYAEAMNESIGKPVLITDRDSIIAVSGAPKKDFMGKSIGQAVELAMQERKSISHKHENDASPKGNIVYEDNGEESYRFTCELINPIVSQGDTVGTVIIADKNNADSIGEVESKLCETAASFLAKQMEQ